MDALLATLGTAGDVFPLIALGRGLRERGHRVTLATLGRFAEVVRGAGLEFAEVPEPPLTQRLAESADVWKPPKGARLVLSGFYAPAVSSVFRIVEERAGPDCVVAATTLAFGARVAQEKLGIPLATIHLQPAFFMSTAEPAVHSSLKLPRWTPPRLVRLLWGALYALLERGSLGELRRFRAELGLPPTGALLTRWIHSPRLVLGLFPEWFGRPAPDWPDATRLTGFVAYDGGVGQQLPPEAEEFLGAGPPPVVFTPGTAMAHARPFFDAAVGACHKTGRRGIVLTRRRDQIPTLPPNLAFFEYLPLSLLLPRASALVHHGGIGSAAQALAAGVPQVITPFNYDQPDNASRLERLGVAETVPASRLDGPGIASALERLLRSGRVARGCRELAGRMDFPGSLERACRALEDLAE